MSGGSTGCRANRPLRCVRLAGVHTGLDKASLWRYPGRRAACTARIRRAHTAARIVATAEPPTWEALHLGVSPKACPRLAACRTQAKEVERLNGVYNQILDKAGVEIIGAPCLPTFCLCIARPHCTPARSTQRCRQASWYPPSVDPCSHAAAHPHGRSCAPRPVCSEAPTALLRRFDASARCCRQPQHCARFACKGRGGPESCESWPAPTVGSKALLNGPRCMRLVRPAEGRGVVLDPHTVEVRASDGSVRQLKAKNILLATGSRAVKAPIDGAVGAGVRAGLRQGWGASARGRTCSDTRMPMAGVAGWAAPRATRFYWSKSASSTAPPPVPAPHSGAGHYVGRGAGAGQRSCWRYHRDRGGRLHRNRVCWWAGEGRASRSPYPSLICTGKTHAVAVWQEQRQLAARPGDPSLRPCLPAGIFRGLGYEVHLIVRGPLPLRG